MNPRKKLSKGELEVARVLWEIGPAAVRDIHEELLKAKAIDITTVQTYLRRIEAKGYARSKLSGRARIYSARAKSATVIRDAVGDLVDRLFGGDSLPLLRHVVEQRDVDAEGLKELRSLIDRIEKEQNAKRRPGGDS